MGSIEELKAALTLGRIDRRTFMSGAVAMGLSAAIGTSVANAVAAATPKRGGNLRIGLGSGSTTDNLDPATVDSTFNKVWSFGSLRNALTVIEADGSLKPELTSSWETSDAKIWRFEIRKGVEFHNGKTLEPADVVASINYHRGEATKSGAKALLKEVADVKADGQSVIITLDAANADFAFILADYHFGICPSKDGVIDWASGVGTGPYKFEAYEPGVRAIGARNENYFKADAAYADSIELLTIQDPTARATALMTNSIDVMDRCDPKLVAVLRNRPEIIITEVAGNLHYSMPMDTSVAPFDTLDVRLALKYAIDREAILKSILRGHGVLGNDHPIGRGNRYLNTSLPQRHYDPEKARFHLKKAGAEGLTVSLSAADAAFAGAVDAAVLVAEQAKQSGITINVVREPNDGYWSNVWLKKPWSMSYWSGRATEDLMFSSGYSKNSDWNETHWSNERFETLLVAARAELDDAKRRDMYWEMQKIVSDDGGAIIPVFASYVGAHSSKVGHPDVIGSNYDMDGDKITERWWINS